MTKQQAKPLCPLCGSTDVEPVYNYQSGSNYTFAKKYRCNRCFYEFSSYPKYVVPKTTADGTYYFGK